MTISVEAIYEQGVLRPLWPLDLAEGTKIAVLLAEPIAAKLEVMRETMNDPLFLAEWRKWRKISSTLTPR